MSGVLKTWLAADVAAARAAPGTVRRRRTSGGLALSLHVNGDGWLVVRLGRQNKSGPSLQEAATVINCLPEDSRPSKPAQWTPFTSNGWLGLMAMWELPAKQLALGESG